MPQMDLFQDVRFNRSSFNSRYSNQVRREKEKHESQV